MIEWMLFFIPLWTFGFFVGFYAKQINKWFEEPKPFILHEEILVETPKELERLLFHRK
tara:strand:+ start:215 stop:388 length:174 start_codon:yes stop_codon:yes gene_type:complete